ncbi:MAG: IS5 family transposase, partial [Myxococcota bacterium]
QQWFNLSDPQAEDEIYDSEAMRRFARVELGEDKVPDESTILRFRHLLEKHQLTDAIFEAVKDLLEEHRLSLRSGTIVDATIIAAPSSTKNATKTRDPEMKQTRKGNNWHFGMKLHIGTDRRGLVHSLTATHAAASDISQLDQLLHGEESEIYGDQAYWKEADRQAFEAEGVRYRMNRRAPGGNKNQSERWRKINRARSRTRARGEHPFRIIKQLWGFQKTRYRGIAKNLVSRDMISCALRGQLVLRTSLVHGLPLLFPRRAEAPLGRTPFALAMRPSAPPRPARAPAAGSCGR